MAARGFSKLIWGAFFLLAAAFVVVSQLKGFATLGVASIVVGIMALALTVWCVASRHFAFLPIPAAALYIILMEPLGLPKIEMWAVILAAALTCLGLYVLLTGTRFK